MVNYETLHDTPALLDEVLRSNITLSCWQALEPSILFLDFRYTPITTMHNRKPSCTIIYPTRMHKTLTNDLRLISQAAPLAISHGNIHHLCPWSDRTPLIQNTNRGHQTQFVFCISKPRLHGQVENQKHNSSVNVILSLSESFDVLLPSSCKSFQRPHC